MTVITVLAIVVPSRTSPAIALNEIGELAALVHARALLGRADELLLRGVVAVVVGVDLVIVVLAVPDLGHHLGGDVAALPQQPRPQLDPNDSKDEEHEEAQEEDVAQHWQGVQEKHHQNPHACGRESHGYLENGGL